MKSIMTIHALIGLLFTTMLVSAEISAPKNNPKPSAFRLFKQGKPPEDIDNARRRWLTVLQRMPENARLSDFRRLFGASKSIGVKSLKSLNREIWEINGSFFVIFETRIEDLGLDDPRLVGKPELQNFTFVGELPSMEVILDRSKANWFTTFQSKAEQVGADQPATAPESKSEGDEKPKPESEGRSQ